MPERTLRPAVAKALMHPVSLHLIETYLGSDIHYCQCPGFSILRPAEKVGENDRVEPGGAVLSDRIGLLTQRTAKSVGL